MIVEVPKDAVGYKFRFVISYFGLQIVNSLDGVNCEMLSHDECENHDDDVIDDITGHETMVCAVCLYIFLLVDILPENQEMCMFSMKLLRSLCSLGYLL